MLGPIQPQHKLSVPGYYSVSVRAEIRRNVTCSGSSRFWIQAMQIFIVWTNSSHSLDYTAAVAGPRWHI